MTAFRNMRSARRHNDRTTVRRVAACTVLAVLVALLRVAPAAAAPPAAGTTWTKQDIDVVDMHKETVKYDVNLADNDPTMTGTYYFCAYSVRIRVLEELSPTFWRSPLLADFGLQLLQDGRSTELMDFPVNMATPTIPIPFDAHVIQLDHWPTHISPAVMDKAFQKLITTNPQVDVCAGDRRLLAANNDTATTDGADELFQINSTPHFVTVTADASDVRGVPAAGVSLEWTTGPAYISPRRLPTSEVLPGQVMYVWVKRSVPGVAAPPAQGPFLVTACGVSRATNAQWTVTSQGRCHISARSSQVFNPILPVPGPGTGQGPGGTQSHLAAAQVGTMAAGAPHPLMCGTDALCWRAMAAFTVGIDLVLGMLVNISMTYYLEAQGWDPVDIGVMRFVVACFAGAVGSYMYQWAYFTNFGTRPWPDGAKVNWGYVILDCLTSGVFAVGLYAARFYMRNSLLPWTRAMIARRTAARLSQQGQNSLNVALQPWRNPNSAIMQTVASPPPPPP